MQSKNQKIIITIVAVILIISIAYVKMRNGKQTGSEIATSTTTTLATSTNQVSLNGNGSSDYIVEAVPIKNTAPKITQPDLSKPIVFSASTNYSEEIKQMYIQKINELKAKIKSTPNSLLPWIDLGSYEKAIGNYQAALEDWSYVSQAAPTDYLSLGNIGNLYAYYLKDNAMAEYYYKKAISNGPKQTYLYIQLAEVYKDVFKDISKAIEIIDQGLKILPGDQALIEFKNSIK